MSEGAASMPKNSNKPKNSAFRQQRLPAWQPILTAKTVIPVFIGIAFVFIPLGVVMILASNGVSEYQVDYTQCKMVNGSRIEDETCAARRESGHDCQCRVEIELIEKFEGDVYLYYGLTNFYQNHRRYVKSRDDNQLHGDVSATADLDGNCAPFKNDSLGRPYAPCGAIANSLFTDSFLLEFKSSEGRKRVPLLRTGIAWNTDKSIKFKNPPHARGELAKAFEGTVKPRDWPKNWTVYTLDTTNEDNNGYENEDLIVWMRTAALPNFRKLHRRLDRSSVAEFKDGLPKGKYTLTIDYRFFVTSFGGTKRFILSTTSWLGGKNNFLGVGYVVVGALSLTLGLLFVLVHNHVGHSLVRVKQGYAAGSDVGVITPRTAASVSDVGGADRFQF